MKIIKDVTNSLVKSGYKKGLLQAKDIAKDFIDLLISQNYQANGRGVTRFKMSNFKEATEWINNEHLTLLAGIIARGI